MTRLVTFLFVALAVSLAGCSCTSPGCDFPVQCVATCGGTASSACGACPAGTVPISSCIDAAIVDAAAHDGGRDADRDTSVTDTGTRDTGPDAFENDAAVVCNRPNYPVDSTATRDEADGVVAAAAAFTTTTGVSVDLDPTNSSVTGFSAPFPVTLDASISDPCARALDALQHFITDNDAMLRMPPNMMMRACSYDSLTDAEVVRIHGGTYDGRRLIGRDNDLVMHVTRSGTVRFWGGTYLPVTERLFPQPCLDAAGLESSVVGDALHYLHFSACVPGTAGSVMIRADDTRTAGESALYVDATGLIHVARRVEVLLLASHVTASEEGSDLYCCGTPSLSGCVGNYLIVDEISGEILQEMPRCLTC